MRTPDPVSHPSDTRQTTDTVVMIRPRHFFSNPDTATSNEFQGRAGEADANAAMAEFDSLAGTLRSAGVRVIEFEAGAEPPVPDAVFPNNWLSTHADGTVVTYPMQPPSRRAERRGDIVHALAHEHGLRVSRHIDLAALEERNLFVEGTGSLVLDRVQRRAYACRSVRTHDAAVAEFAGQLGYQTIVFDAFGPSGLPVYHTNVLMCVGTQVIVACVDAIAPADRERVTAAMRADHELVPITLAQMSAFAGNMLELRSREGEALLVMSASARAALDDEQAGRLSAHARLISAPIAAIEQAAGGSVRCMLAEIFLPPGTGA